MSLETDRSTNLVVMTDFFMGRKNDNFRLCDQCPHPPSKDAKYKILCNKHK